jgi:hypothetical protein
VNECSFTVSQKQMKAEQSTDELQIEIRKPGNDTAFVFW